MACIADMEVLRFTPGGVPAIKVELKHTSQQTEADQQRDVHAQIKAVAFGSVAMQLSQLSLHVDRTFHGFLATPRNGKHAVLHIQSIQ